MNTPIQNKDNSHVIRCEMDRESSVIKFYVLKQGQSIEEGSLFSSWLCSQDTTPIHEIQYFTSFFTAGVNTFKGIEEKIIFQAFEEYADAVMFRVGHVSKYEDITVMKNDNTAEELFYRYKAIFIKGSVVGNIDNLSGEALDKLEDNLGEIYAG